MRFTVVIPTYKREKKLKRCIKSILNGKKKEVVIYAIHDQGDEETADEIRSEFRDTGKVVSYALPGHNYVIGIWNWFARTCWMGIKDAMVWIVDDVELDKNCLREVEKVFTSKYQDFDGVVGISQRCQGDKGIHGTPYGQMAIGKKFINRYPDKQLCCKAYTHFYQDEELWKYAKSLNKFTWADKALLTHYHPCFVPKEMDATHKIVRGATMKADKLIYEDRKKRGLIWGQSFEL